MSADRLRAPHEVAEIVDGAIARAKHVERLKCAEIAQLYPLDGFAYDTNNLEELLRLRDAISQAISKHVPKGEMIK